MMVPKGGEENRNPDSNPVAYMLSIYLGATWYYYTSPRLGVQGVYFLAHRYLKPPVVRALIESACCSGEAT
jgi:hypothetical protein